MATRRNLERQRERIREAIDADPERSSTSIAKEIGCGVNTVIRTRERHVPRDDRNGTTGTARAGSENLIAPAEGNSLAERHGAYSAARRADLEPGHRDRLRLAYPSAPDDLINAMAKRLAMIDLFSAWLADAGVVHRGPGGLPAASDAARELRLLLRDHEASVATLTELERPDPVAAAYAHTRRIQEATADGRNHDPNRGDAYAR